MEEIRDYSTARFISVDSYWDGDEATVTVAMELPRRKLLKLDKRNGQRLVEALTRELGRLP